MEDLSKELFKKTEVFMEIEKIEFEEEKKLIRCICAAAASAEEIVARLKSCGLPDPLVIRQPMHAFVAVHTPQGMILGGGPTSATPQSFVFQDLMGRRVDFFGWKLSSFPSPRMAQALLNAEQMSSHKDWRRM